MTEDLPGYPAERVKAFVDAVVAIAMTLLILPLMDSVGDGARVGQNAAEWLVAEAGSLYVFVLSFVLIAMFWSIHHRLFVEVERVTGGLVWLLVAWLLTIVWLPVATAMTGQFDDDPLQKTLYIGSMILPCLMMLAIRLHLRGHPLLHDATQSDLRAGMSADLSMIVLFAVAFVVAVTVPVVGYYALFLLALVGPVSTVTDRMLGVSGRGR